MNTYCMYLRKSRADLEAEARGEGETLKKHHTQLLALANRMNINVTKVYREIVSGERIMERPYMQELLSEVEDGLWTGVLVMEVERLARGDTMDQGIVAQTFKYAGTKIITPLKTYDPNNEFDEEYFEFGLFMSRREYKTINRRLQHGRIASASDGNYLGNIPPYGYLRKKLQDGSFSLEPHPDQAPVVKMIFEMYTSEGVGMGQIARKLNTLSIPTAKNKVWTAATLNGIIRNPVYIGKIAWNRRPMIKMRKSGNISKSRPRVDAAKWILVAGKHESIINTVIWHKAQDILCNRSHPPAPMGVTTSSLAGLIRCGFCGRSMVRRPYAKDQPPSLICTTPMCTNVSSSFELVEEIILNSLKSWLKEYKADWETNRPDDHSLDEEMVQSKIQIVRSLEKKIRELKVQDNNLHDLLERKVYTVEKYLERSKYLSERISETESALEAARMELETEIDRQKAVIDIIPNAEHVLDIYSETDDPALKNGLLKSVLEVAIYKKTVRGHWSRPDSLRKFDLKLYPKLPRKPL